MMKRLVSMVVAAGAAVAAVAMPTKAALQKAQKMVSDVTAADVKALRVKSKTPAEVAAKHMELAGQAGNEAEKYVLLQGAFKLYAKAGDYEGAANALGMMNREISDMNPEVIVEIYNKAIFSSMKEKAPKLHAIKEAARRQVTYRKLLAKAEAAVKANPKDATAQKKLGECHAELGNWPKALDAFALAGGDLAKTAKAELDGSAAPQVSGDFWWDYESGDEMSTYKFHAAELYRAALSDESFKGLARTRTEQRVKEAEEFAVDLPSMNSEVISSTDVANANVSLGSPFKTKGNESVFDFGGEFGKMEFVRCPPGKVKMRLFGNHKTAEVKISRPFWIQKSPMVIGLVKTVHADTRGRNNAYHATLDMHIGGIQRDIANRFASALPPGYVVRLPTLAEIQYAYHANVKNRTDAYYDLESPHSGDVVDKLVFMQGDDNAMRGKTRSNAWGLFDFGRFERTLDRFAPSDLRFVGLSSDEARQKLFKHCQIVELPEPSADVDPLYWGETAHEYLGVWFCPKFYAAWTYGVGAIRGGDERTFYRFVIGPDLVAEKKAGTSTTRKLMTSGKAPTPKCKMVNGRPAPLKFELAKGVDLELEGCPAGKFTMGYDFRPEGGWNWDGKAAPKHEVVITRPFWIGKYQVTRDQLDTLGCGQFTDEQMMAALNAMDGAGGKHCAAQSALAEAERLCRKLNEKFCDRLPRGYVFRLPTDAEWEYASKAGNYLKSNPAMAYGVPGKYFVGYAQYADVRKELIQKAMKWDKRVPPGPVGSKSPNDWGIYDAVGNGDELVLDRLPCSNEDVVRCDKTYKHVVVYLQPAKDKTDPLHYQDGSDYYCLVRAEALTKFAFKAGGERPATFRVCLGPDLVAEKAAKK